MKSFRVAPVMLMLAMPLAADAQQKSTTPMGAKSKPAAPAATAVALPSGREIADRYVTAIGGREQFVRHSAMHVTGTFDMPAAGITAPLEIYSAKPNKTVVKITIPGMGEMLQGVDGAVAWDLNATSGPRLLAGKELQQRLQGADFDAALHNASNFSSLETVGLTDIEGTPAYKVRLVRISGDTSYEYFDPTTNLQRGAESTAETPMGKITVVAVMSDYKSFDGMLMPTTITQKMSTAQVTMKLASVEFDKVDPSIFNMPAPIKTLIGK